MFTTNKKYTHMPFLFEYNGENMLLFSAANETAFHLHDYKPWSVYCYNLDTNVYYKITENPDNNIECSGVVFWEKNELRFGYIVSKLNERNITYSYRCCSTDDMRTFTELKSKEQVFCVTENNKWFIYAKKRYEQKNKKLYDELFFENKITNEKNMIVSNILDQVLRITYIFGQNDKIIITGTKKEEFKSYVLDLATNERHWIMTNNKHVYKCSIYKDTLCYAQRLKDFEERKLVFTTNFELVAI